MKVCRALQTGVLAHDLVGLLLEVHRELLDPLGLIRGADDCVLLLLVGLDSKRLSGPEALWVLLLGVD